MKKLPEPINTFYLDKVEGIVTKHEYSGEFTSQIPNLKMQASIARYRSLLNGGDDAGLDLGTRNLHHMIAYLKNVLTEMPSWWKECDYGYDLYDINVIEAVYEKALEHENKWVEAAWGGKDDDKKEKKPKRGNKS